MYNQFETGFKYMTFMVFHLMIVVRWTKMKDKMKNRLALLGVLLVAGLVMAGIGTVLGAGDLLRFAGDGKKVVEAVAMGGKIYIYEDGKLVKEVTMPEGEYTLVVYQSSEYKIEFRKMTQEEIEEAKAKHEKEINRWLEIANNDSRIQELTNGKGIQSKDILWAKIEGDEAILTVKVEGKNYRIRIDLNGETVKSVEEQSPSRP